MAIIEKSTWSGLPINEVRPQRAGVRMLQQLKTVAEDQAYAHKHGLGIEVPNAPSSDVAADHVHDGTNGAVIPLPYCHTILGATLEPGTSSSSGWQPVARQLFWNLAGVTTVRLIIWSSNPPALLDGGLRVRVRDATSGLPVTQELNFFTQTAAYSSGGLLALYADLTVTADALQIVQIDCWHSASLQGGTVPMFNNRYLNSFALIPWLGEPFPAYSWRDHVVTTGQIDTPATTQHLGAHPFTSFDDAMFNDGRAVSSYLVQSLALNEAYLWERATGKPAPLNADGHSNPQQYDGHAHGGSSTSGATDNTGAEMDHSLGSWHYGVGCSPPDIGGATPTNLASYLNVDMVNSTDRNFGGRIHAPTIITGTASETVASHVCRLPGGQTGTYEGVSTNLKCAALVYADWSKAGNFTFHATVRDEDGVNPGTTGTATITSGGPSWQVVQINNLDDSGTGTTGEVVRRLTLAIQQASTPASPASAIGSSCLWLQR